MIMWYRIISFSFSSTVRFSLIEIPKKSKYSISLREIMIFLNSMRLP